MHPQTQLTLSYDGQPLPPRRGFRMKLRMPTKLGCKNPQHIQAVFVTNTFPGGYWEDRGYNRFGGSALADDMANKDATAKDPMKK